MNPLGMKPPGSKEDGQGMATGMMPPFSLMGLPGLQMGGIPAIQMGGIPGQDGAAGAAGGEDGAGAASAAGAANAVSQGLNMMASQAFQALSLPFSSLGMQASAGLTSLQGMPFGFDPSQAVSGGQPMMNFPGLFGGMPGAGLVTSMPAAVVPDGSAPAAGAQEGGAPAGEGQPGGAGGEGAAPFSVMQMASGGMMPGLAPLGLGMPQMDPNAMMQFTLTSMPMSFAAAAPPAEGAGAAQAAEGAGQTGEQTGEVAPGEGKSEA